MMEDYSLEKNEVGTKGSKGRTTVVRGRIAWGGGGIAALSNILIFVHVCVFAESLHRLRHQRQAPDAAHATEQAEFSVQNVGVCGVAAV